MRSFLIIALAWLMLSLPDIINAQQNYSVHAEITQRLQTLNRQHGNLTNLTSLTKTEGDKDIWLLTIGRGDIEKRPAIAVVGGVEGSHILGIELAVQFAEKLLTESQYSALLDSVTFYVFPNLSPDASEQYFSSTLKYERSGNARITDDDRDGYIGEDGFNDLNGDGLITLFRVKDATGNMMPHPADNRVMIKADPNKGETGSWIVHGEGTDEDKDGHFNEDPASGVHLNKNFSFRYPHFASGAGEHAVSEKENRALLDFLFDAWNVYAVVSFSPNNNLSNPWRFNRAGIAQRIITGPYEADTEVMGMVSELYNGHVNKDNAANYELQPGGFLEWGYFHYGRFSFSTPAWWAPKAAVPSADERPDGWVANTDNNPEVNFLRWAESEGLNDVFVEWQTVDHPDFPGKTVGVGGIKPFAMTTPPYSMIGDVVQKHTDFIVDLANARPKLGLENMNIESLGNGLTRITVDIHNHGLFPSATQLGTRTKWVRPINVTVELGNNMELISGRPHQQIAKLDGDSNQTYTWLVRGRGSFKLTAGTPNSGFVTAEQSIR
jgi:hypothetical protein